jgi:hypothetical protein
MIRAPANRPRGDLIGKETLMKLSAVYIKHFRSVRDTKIEGIDNFNVFIGKNNSGKSNLLSAISAFFQIISNDSIVSPRPVIGDLSDFTDKDSDNPISISATLIPSREETVAMLKKIREERPQMETALEALPQSLALSIRITVLPPPQRFSFVEEIAFDILSHPPRSFLLLKTSLASAEELHRNYVEDEGARRLSEAFSSATERLDEDDFRRIRSRSEGSEAYVLRAYLDSQLGLGSSAPPEAITTLRRMLASTQSLPELRTALNERVATLNAERRVIAERRLSTRVKTVSGDEDQIPAYAQALTRPIATKKILFLQERRKPIGAEEAQKILNLKTRRGGSETFTRIQNIVVQLLGARIDAFSSAEPRRSAEMDVDDFLV